MTSFYFLQILMVIFIQSVILAVISFVIQGRSFISWQKVKFIRVSILTLWVVFGFSLVARAFHQNRLTDWISDSRPVTVFQGTIQSLPIDIGPSRWQDSFALVYSIVATMMVLFLIWNYWRMRQILKDSFADPQDPRVCYSKWVTSPMSFGIFSPQVFLPLSMQAHFSVDVVIAHEKTHIERHDPQWKIFALLSRGVFFFAPGVWILQKHLEYQSEVECDRLTMLKKNISVAYYGEILIESVLQRYQQKQQTIPNYLSETNLRRRIQAMKAKRTYQPMWSMIGGVFIFLAASASALATVSPSFRESYQISAKIYMGDKLVASPRVQTIAGEEAIIEMAEGGTQRNPENFLKMRILPLRGPDMDGQPTIDMQMDVFVSRGGTTKEAKPHFVAKSGEAVQINLETDAAQNKLRMEFIAEQK